jgi:hypothetical protein
MRIPGYRNRGQRVLPQSGLDVLIVRGHVTVEIGCRIPRARILERFLVQRERAGQA